MLKDAFNVILKDLLITKLKQISFAYLSKSQASVQELLAFENLN